MTGLANATGAPVLTRCAVNPVRPQAPLWRPQQSWQRYRDLKPRDTAPPAPPAGGDPPAPPPQRKKGKRPTHEITRVLQVDGRKAYQPVAVVWLREDGRGFIRLNADLRAGDDLIIAPLAKAGGS
jgi:hypothetical protein